MKSIRNNIGLDAHTGSSFFVVLNRGGEVVKREKIRTTEKEMISFIRSVPRPRALAFEESSIAQWLYVLLKDEVNELIVCDPAANVKKRGSKTDFGDALELADLLRVGRLRPVYHSFDERMQLRTLISGYPDLIQDVVRAKNRYQAVFRLNGQPVTVTQQEKEES